MLFTILCLLYGSCQLIEDDDFTPVELPAIGLNVDETLLSSWMTGNEEGTESYTNLAQETASATKLRHTKYLGATIGDNFQFGWIDIGYDVDSVFLILDLEFPLPNTDGRSVYVQLIRKEALSFLTLDEESDTYSYTDIDDFKQRFIHEGEYDEGDHYAKIISTQYATEYPDHGSYALGFPTTQNDFRIRYTLDSEIGMIVSGTFKGKCYMFSCGYAEVSELENGNFNAFIGY